MTKIIFGLILIASCSNLPLGTKVKKIPTTSEYSAHKIIQNKMNFLISLFEQSVDPYYNVPKWSETCLKANSIGKTEETNTYLRQSSILYLRDGQPGFCPTDSKAEKYFVIYQYCKNTNEILELNVPYEKNQNFMETNLCL